MKQYHVYIMASRSRVLYTGITGNLIKRIGQHKEKRVSGFTRKYNVSHLVYAEEFSRVQDAIAREKQIKGWTREKKIALIGAYNPDWSDLGDRMWTLH